MSRHLDSSTTTQMAQIMVQYGRPSRYSWTESVRSSSGRTTMEKGKLRTFCWKTVGKHVQIGNAHLWTEENILVCVCGRHKTGWKVNKILTQRGKILMKDVGLGEPTSFFDHVYLGCTQRECQTSKDIVENYRSTGWPARPGPLLPLKTRNASPFGLLFGRNGPFWEVREIEISMRDFGPFSWFEPSLFGVYKHQSWSVQKIRWNTQWIDQKCMLFNTSCFKNVFLTQGKVHFAKMFFFFFRNFEPPHFCTVFYHLRHGRQKKMSQGARNQGFWDRFRELEFFVQDASQNITVLPRVVCLCGAVGLCGECHGVKWRDNDVFLRCVFAWYDAESQDHCST